MTIKMTVTLAMTVWRSIDHVFPAVVRRKQRF